jgi:hypothetical protein
LVDGVKKFAKKCTTAIADGDGDGEGSGSVHLIWVTPSPYPKCQTTECKQRRRFNNHHAIGAVTQILKSQIEQAVVEARSSVSSSSSASPPFTFEVLDSRWIAEPKMERREYPCKNHLLCHPDGEVMLVSRPGLAVAGELLGAVLRHVTGLSPEQLGARHKHEDVVMYTEAAAAAAGEEKEKRYYILNAGILRKIPDIETVQCLNRSSRMTLPLAAAPLSTEALADFPQLEQPLPSRRADAVMVGEFSAGAEWIMGTDCCRSLLNGSGSGNGKEVARVMEMDLEDIPHNCFV